MENDMTNSDAKTHGIAWFVTGVILSFCLMGVAFNVSGAKEQRDGRMRALHDCQKELPRNQTCVLIAVPNKGETE